MSGAVLTLGRISFGTRYGRRFLALLLLAAALAAGYMFWLRDSSLVAVKEVRVEGVSAKAPGAEELEAALTEAAREMTTLHVQAGLLQDAAARFPLVKAVSAEPDFPNSMTVRVVERRPTALIGSGDAAVAVADDGTILRGLPTSELDLPGLPLTSPPEGRALSGQVLEQALVLGATPDALLPYVEGARMGIDGVEVELGGGIDLRFGDSREAERKWRAAATVIADPETTALDYVDLTAPARPAVGGSGHALPTLP